MTSASTWGRAGESGRSGGARSHEKRGDEVVDREDQYDGADHGVGGGAADAERAALAVVALILMLVSSIFGYLMMRE